MDNEGVVNETIKRKRGRPPRTVREALLHYKSQYSLLHYRIASPGQARLWAWEQGRLGGYWEGAQRAMLLAALSAEEKERIINTIYHELGGDYDERSDAGG